MDELTAAGIKALGSLGGAFLALVFQPPTTTRDFVIRSLFAFVSGLLFADPVRTEYLKWPETWQMWLASSGLVALVSWGAGILATLGSTFAGSGPLQWAFAAILILAFGIGAYLFLSKRLAPK